MEVFTAISRPTQQGNADYFTGAVWIDPVVTAKAPARVASARVSFAPGARTAWHTHPLGQTLYVVSGIGWVQMQGGTKYEIHAGDAVWIPPDVIHWHGATNDHAMTHIAIQEALEGRTVEWMHKVSDADYLRK